MVDLYNCWTCKKRLSDEQPEELFFWCNEECYNKDDNYHNRTTITVVETETETQPIQEAPTSKQERKRKIREALAGLSNASNDNTKKTNANPKTKIVKTITPIKKKRK